MAYNAGQKVRPSDLVSLVGTFFSQAGTLCTTPAGGTETALVSWAAGSDASVTMKNGRLYRCEVLYGYFDNTNESFVVTTKMRKGVNTTSGQQLGFFRGAGAANGSAFVFSGLGTCYVRNVSGADITFVPGLTITRAVGTGTVALFGDANIEASITVYDVGATSDPALAGRVACSVSIT